MSLSTQPSRIEYTASAAQTIFAYPFRIFAATDLEVYQQGSLLSTSVYSVTGAGDAGGGNVVLNTGATSGDKIILLSRIAYSQDVTYTSGDAFPSASHEKGLDRLARQVQQLKEISDRSLQLNTALSFGLTGLELPAPSSLTLAAGGQKYLSWNDAETNLTLREIAAADDAVGLLSSSLTTSTFAGLPAAGTAGRLRHVTDSLKGVWYDDATRWVPVRQRWSVRDFGCVGDGTVDDTTNFQAALDSGEDLFIPPGRYKITDTLSMTTDVNLSGVGVASEVYLAMGSSKNGLEVDPGGAAGGTIIRGPVWRHFAIAGAASSCLNAVLWRNVVLGIMDTIHIVAGTAASGYAVWLQDFVLQSLINVIINGAYLEDPFVSGTYAVPANGIKATTAAGGAGTFNQVRFDCDLTSVGTGVHVHSGNDGGNNDYRGTYQSITNHAIAIIGGAHAHLHDLHLERGAVSTGTNIQIQSHTNAHVGPNVFCAAAATTNEDLWINGSDRCTVDGFTGNIIKNTGSNSVTLGTLVLNATASGEYQEVSSPQATRVLQPIVAGAGSTVYRQNRGLVDGSSLVVNGSAERWNAALTVPTTSWASIGSAVTWTRESTIVRHGTYAAKASAASASAIPAVTLLNTPVTARLDGQWVSYSAWLYIPTTGGNDITVSLYFDGGSTVAGGQLITIRDAWVRVSGTFLVDSGLYTTSVQLAFVPSAGSTTLYIDGVSAVPSATGAPMYYTAYPEYLTFDADATVNPGTIGAGAVYAQTYTVPGAAVLDEVAVGPAAAIDAGLVWCGVVTAADTVELRIHNTTGSGITPASATWHLRVIRRP